MATHDPHDVVRLTTAQNPVQAHILEQALRTEGIRCKVVGDYLDAGIGDIPGVQVEVWVHPDDLVAAAEVLRNKHPLSEEAPEESGGETQEEPEP